mmetsp:Transcript_1421/g.2136  ORF Transcript_1421/g.2136 Transcript_1421/m.2136 type:complete len:165 (-) Transcript_1421:193-687(-)|eukprot:CAMPEP_0196141228 /NCGR_PEP_ID=MMETSP0910-20130528/9221_1 /TAXON_ID=49265 /ORGANISM="Thalassiosira rotula, Strain GSO102" /LENGTH=164 /DNA_ID=CAMNT_0041402331 /DNA_START=179 /DNA_END=673 /DNA_ORIENTATION=+
MASKLSQIINSTPLPIFGNLRTAALFTTAKVRALPRFAGWIVPLSAGTLWFVWPAVNDEWKDKWKIQMGIIDDPELLTKRAMEGSIGMREREGSEDDDGMLAKAATSGDYGELQARWDEFAEKSSRPGEDDEEDEEEEDDEDDDDDENDDGTGVFRNEIIIEKL